MASLSYFKTTVLTPPATSALTIAQTVMDDWKIDAKDKSFVERTITRCSAAASDYINRQLGIAKYQVVARLERGYRDGHLTFGDKNPIMLPFWPLSSIISITETGVDGIAAALVEGTDYEADYAVGKLYRLDSFQRQRDWRARVYVTAIFWAGYVLPGQDASAFPGASTLPAHVEDAIGRMVASRYFERSRDPFLKSETVEGVGRFDYIVNQNSGDDGGNLSPDVLDILNNFRQPVVA